MLLAQATAATFTTETAQRQAGALRSLRPRVSVPPPARWTLLAAGAATQQYGLGTTSHAYAITAALLALAALAALTASRRGAARPEADRSH
ncbi:hypothetical protein ACYBSK_19155 [Streptomyces sp. BYX5S]